MHSASGNYIRETAQFKHGETSFHYLSINIVDRNKCIRNTIPRFLFFTANSLRFLIFNSDTKLYTYLPLDFESACIEMKRHSGYECKRTSLFTGNFTMKMEKKNAKEGKKKKKKKKKFPTML